MAFDKKSAQANMLRIVLLVAFVILLGVSAYRLYTGESDNYWLLGAPIVFIILMAIQIRLYYLTKSK